MFLIEVSYLRKDYAKGFIKRQFTGAVNGPPIA